MSSDTKSLGVWADIVQYRRAYTLTAVASFGGMLFGWDTVGAKIHELIKARPSVDIFSRA